MEEFFSREEARLREKQSVCQHPSFKCSLCNLYKDNIVNDYQTEIDVLLVILDLYENLLDKNNIPHPSYFDYLNNGIIDEYRKEMIRKYFTGESNTD